MAALKNAAPLVLLVLLCAFGTSEAQGLQCGTRDAIIEALGATYQEKPVSRGVTSTGALMEVLAGPSGSWSILVTAPGGATCLVSSGEGWRQNISTEEEEPAA